MTSRLSLGAALLGVLVLGTGCAIQAPPYQPSINNVSQLKRDTTQPVRVGTFSIQPGAVGGVSVSIRGGAMNSPVGAHYADYLAAALQRDLQLAQRFDPQAAVSIEGTLLSNDVDAAIGRGTGHMEARFVVSRDGRVRFDKVKRGTHDWESSFAAMVAVPAAQQAYPQIVQNLLSSLFADPDFLSALK